MKRVVSDWSLFNFDVSVELFGVPTSGIFSFPDYNLNRLVFFDLRDQVPMYILISLEIQGIDESFVDRQFGKCRKGNSVFVCFL